MQHKGCSFEKSVSVMFAGLRDFSFVVGLKNSQNPPVMFPGMYCALLEIVPALMLLVSTLVYNISHGDLRKAPRPE